MITGRLGSLRKFMKTFVLGVTGVMGSGKSRLCRFLKKEFGFYWIEADRIVHLLYKAGQPGYFRIKKYFGKKFVSKKEVKRDLLRKFVFKNPHKLDVLNKVIHPLVMQEVNKKIIQLKRLYKGKKPLFVCIEAIYFETFNLGKFVDRLIVVDADDDKIFEHVKKRKIPRDQLKSILAFQRRNILKIPHVLKLS